MREGLGRYTAPAKSRVDHSSDAAIDRSTGASEDVAFQDYVQLARPLWTIVRDRTAAFRATRRDTDPEVVHALRVALRRLKALQWAYRTRVETPGFEAERQATKKLLKTAGSVRDWDVALSLADDWVPRSRKTRTALSTVRADAAIFGVSDLTQQLAQVRAVSAAPVAEAHDTATDNVMAFSRPIDLAFLATRLETARKQMRKRVKRAADASADHYADMHEVRKAGKRVRDVHALIVEFTHARRALIDDAAMRVDAPSTKGEGHRATPIAAEESGFACERQAGVPSKKQLKKQAKRQDKWASRLLSKRQRRRLQRVQSRFGALNDVVHSAELLRTTGARSGRFAHTSGVDRFIRTLDEAADRYRLKALAVL